MCKLKHKLWIFDVDGTFTDSGVIYDNSGNELKKFSTRDAAGLFALHFFGAKTMVLTGRECYATERRMKELKVDYIYQNIKNKKQFLLEFAAKKQINLQEIAYVGDDVNDLPVMGMCGYKACPADACKEIKKIVNITSEKKGGEGAVRDIIEKYLDADNLWEEAMYSIYAD